MRTKPAAGASAARLDPPERGLQMSEFLAPASDVSTDHVAPHQRLEFWEAHNASALIGLRCSTFASDGLRARERTFDLGSVRFTEICGNEHVVERSPRMLRTHPKESVFASVLLQGNAFLFQSGQCINAAVGDVLVYSTDIAYLHGFTADMRLLVVEADLAGAPGRLMHPRAPIKVDTRLRSGRLLAGALRSTAVGFVERPLAEDVPGVVARTRGLMQALRSPPSAHGELTDSAYWLLLRAEAYIGENLQQPGLDAQTVAKAVGKSLRQLNRLFAARQSSVSHTIWQQRLARAAEDLGSTALRRMPVGDIADRWGFASQAHFARAFRACYGLSPSEHRRQALAAA
jgi:AraC-like DNA-binding protein